MNKQGSVYVVQDTYKGRRIAKVAFCIAREQYLTRAPNVDYISKPKHTITSFMIVYSFYQTQLRFSGIDDTYFDKA